MPQHDFTVDGNQTFPNFEIDLNAAIMALGTNSSGNTPPTITYPHQLWIDTSTTTATLRIRNAANTAWISLGTASTNLGHTTPQDVSSQIANNIFTGNVAPVAPVANQIWIDTSTNPQTIRVRNNANNTWTAIGTASSNMGITPSAIGATTLSEVLANTTIVPDIVSEIITLQNSFTTLFGLPFTIIRNGNYGMFSGYVQRNSLPSFGTIIGTIQNTRLRPLRETNVILSDGNTPWAGRININPDGNILYIWGNVTNQLGISNIVFSYL